MNCVLHVIGTDTVDLTPSLILVCGNRKYMFNAGEGTQRLCLEHFVRMGQLDTILFTRLNWEEIGGFPGMILTTAETTMKTLTVCGPPGIQDFLTSTRFYLQRNDFVMHIREFKGNNPPPLVDDLMRIYPIILDPSQPPPKSREVANEEEEVPKESADNAGEDSVDIGDSSNSEDSEDSEDIDDDVEDGEQSQESKDGKENQAGDNEKIVEPLTGIVYIPSARRNQKLFIRKQNVENVVSLMFSKRRQLTENEEFEAQCEFYDTGYEGRRRKPKKARKDENINFAKDTEKMKLACNDPKLLVHEDFFGVNPSVVREGGREGGSDDEIDLPATSSTSTTLSTPATTSTTSTPANSSTFVVGSVPDITPVSEKKTRKDRTPYSTSISPDPTSPTPSLLSNAKVETKPISRVSAQQTSPPSFTFSLGNPSGIAFPSISSKIPLSNPSANSLFGASSLFSLGTTSTSTTFPSFPTSSSLTPSLGTQPPPSVSPAETNSTSPPIDIFGKQKSPFCAPTPFGKFEPTEIGNSSLFGTPFTPPVQPLPEKDPVEPLLDDAQAILKRDQLVFCYACHMQDIIRIDFEKARAFGVPDNLFDQLREGKTVKSETTGNFVTPQDCLAEPIPGPAFLVIHCPSKEYMPYIIYNSVFEEYFLSVEYVVHMTHHDALATKEYQKWMHKFNTIEHVIINKEVCTHHYVYPTSAIHQYRMNTLHQDIFPLPHYKEPTAVLPNKCNCCCGSEFVEKRIDPRDFRGLPENTSVGEVFLQMVLYPYHQQGVDRTGVVMRGSVPRCKAGVQELAGITGLEAAVDQLNLTRKEMEQNTPIPKEQPRILFLGTASALPSKYRNVSGIYFEPILGSGMLLDAGEGSYGMLYRRFGDQLDEVISSLKAAWISHIHADHHLGLIRILLKRKECNAKKPLMVIGPRPVGRWLSEYDQKIQPLFYDFVDCGDITSSLNYITPFFDKEFGFKSIYTMEVMHCAEAFGLVVIHRDGWKVVISGDTRPCPKIEEEGKEAFLLIHEATLETGLEADAHERGHSTCGQALTSFKKMNAKWVILTHFSQRYPSIPKLPDDARDKVGIAYDLMDIKWSDIPLLPHLLAPMGLVLDHEEKSKAAAAQRTRDYYTEREKKQAQERIQAKRIKFHSLEDDNEKEENEDEKNTYFNRFGRGKGGVRGFSVDPNKRRGRVDNSKKEENK